MDPVSFKSNPWPPVTAADRSARGDLALSGEKDRRKPKAGHPRRRPRESDQDPDEFRHQPPEEESSQ